MDIEKLKKMVLRRQSKYYFGVLAAVFVGVAGLAGTQLSKADTAGVAAGCAADTALPATSGNKTLDLALCDDFDGAELDKAKWAYPPSTKPGGYNDCTVAGGSVSLAGCTITVASKYGLRYGYVEMRAQLPAGKGSWPPLWTWAAAGAAAKCNYGLSFDPSEAMHVYAMDIQPSGIAWYVDGAQVCQAASKDVTETRIRLTNALGALRVDYVRTWE